MMKIRRYPGKAVDVSANFRTISDKTAGENINGFLSAETEFATMTNNIPAVSNLEPQMGVLYAASWIETQKNLILQEDLIKSVELSNDKELSRLAKYQEYMDKSKFDNMKDEDKLEISRALRELNGYRPSSLRRKNRKQFTEWTQEDSAKVEFDKNLRNNDSFEAYNNKERYKQRQRKSDDVIMIRPPEIIDQFENKITNCRTHIPNEQHLKENFKNSTTTDTTNYVKLKANERSNIVSKDLIYYDIIAKSLQNNDSETIEDINLTTANGDSRNSSHTSQTKHLSSPKPPVPRPRSDLLRSAVSRSKNNNDAVVTQQKDDALTFTRRSDDSSSSNESPIKNHDSRSSSQEQQANSRNDFSIPRPKLIVPVHTYARKRRTGNLNSAKPERNKGNFNNIYIV